MVKKKMAKTWEDVRTFDDIVLEEEREILSEVEKEAKSRCPCLERQDKFFYYCGKNLSGIKDKTPSPVNPIYLRKVGLAELQIYCMGNFENCCIYSGKLKR
jgi:hypothetical protein